MKKLILAGILLAVLNATPAIDDLMRNLQSNQQAIQSYSATVITVVDGNYIPSKQTQVGYIYFQAPDFVRTDTQTPIVSTVTKGQKSWTIDQQGNIQEIIPEQRALQDFQDIKNIFKEFTFTSSDVSKNEIKLIGVPKNNTSIFKHFSKIVLIIDPQQNIAKEIQIYNQQGVEIAKIITTYLTINSVNFPQETKTIITYGKNKLSITTTYKNIQLNQPLPSDTFELEHIKNVLQQGTAHA
jgi:outer membrane lipoprotein-sorting protein